MTKKKWAPEKLKEWKLCLHNLSRLYVCDPEYEGRCRLCPGEVVTEAVNLMTAELPREK